MAESAESMFRRGMISHKQASRLGVLRGTRAEPSKMADFDDKRDDEGDGKERGDRVASSRHINDKRTTRAGSPIASKPTKGGQAGAEHQPSDDEIDQAAHQRPAFPKQGKGTTAVPRKIRKRGTPSGPLYGGPSNRKYG